MKCKIKYLEGMKNLRQWISTAIFWVIFGLFGLLHSPTPIGFLAYFLTAIGLSFIVVANIVPYAGLPLYWLIGTWYEGLILNIAGLEWNIVSWIPFGFYFLLGLIIYIPITLLITAVLGTILSRAIYKWRHK